MAGQFKPGAYKAFVVKEKTQKRLKAKQRQQEQKMLLSWACLSFVVSFYWLLLLFFNQGANFCIIFCLCK
jgi:hypothetical protein